MKAAVVMEDEEPLFLVPNNIVATQRPPGCGVCCNTRCGSYFITAFHMSVGLLLMLTAFYGDPTQLDVMAASDPKDRKMIAMAYMVRRESIFLWGCVITVISMLTFRGIRCENHRLLNPTIVLQYLQMVFTMIQTAFTIMYWPNIAKAVREHLILLADKLDDEFTRDPTIDEQSREEWSDFEHVIKDDSSWANLSPKILYMVTLWHSVQILVIGWMIWTVTFHKKWIQHKYDGSTTRSTNRYVVPGVIIGRKTVRK